MWKRTENGFEISISLNPFKVMSKALEKTANWLSEVADHISPEAVTNKNEPVASETSQSAAEPNAPELSSSPNANPVSEIPGHAYAAAAVEITDKQRKKFEAAQYYDAANNCLRLDLHGCTMRQAEQTLNQKILECHYNGIRFLDVVYGFSGRKLAEAVNRKLSSESTKRYIRDQCHVELDYGKVIPCDHVDESTGVVLAVKMNPHRVVIDYEDGRSRPVYLAKLPCFLCGFKTAAGREIARLEATERSTLPQDAPMLNLSEWMEHYQRVDVLPDDNCNNQWNLETEDYDDW